MNGLSWHGEDTLAPKSRNQLSPQQRPSVPPGFIDSPVTLVHDPERATDTNYHGVIPLVQPVLSLLANYRPKVGYLPVPPADATSLQLLMPPSGSGALIIVVVGLSEDLFRALELPEQSWVLALGAPKQGQRRGTQRVGSQSIPGVCF